jgi:ferrous-iron efflux pump FieF
MFGMSESPIELDKRRQSILMRAAGAASITVAAALIVLKIWAWVLTDSVALLSSLADSLLDLLASIITFLAVRMAVTPADREHRFGHGKSEGIAGIAQAAIIAASAGFVAFRAVLRLVAPSEVTEPNIGIGIMIVSLVLTTTLVGFQRFVIRRTGSLAISADAAHYRADILTNLAVIAAIIASTRFGWLLADPLLGLVIVALILASAASIAKESIDILLDRELPTEIRQKIAQLALEHPEVLGVHDIRTRSSGSAQFIQFHLELDEEMTLGDVHAISDEVQAAVEREFPTAEVLIHADPHGLPETRDPF